MAGADVGELVLATVGQAVAGPDDVGGAVVQDPDEVVEPLAGLGVQDVEVRTGSGLLGHQVTERGVAVLVDRGVQRHVVAAPAHQVEHAVDVHAELGGDLVRLRVTAQLALEGATRTADLVELLDHVDGEAYDASLLRDAAGDRLTHPPGGVGRELVALGVVELLDRADQAGVALLDQVEHRHLGAAVLAGDRHHQPQVGLDEPVDRGLALLGEPLELGLAGAHRRSALAAADPAGVEQVLGQQARLDGLGELDLGLGVEQGGAGDLVQVETDAVAALDLTSRGGALCLCSAHLRPPAPRATTPCRTPVPTPVFDAGFPIGWRCLHLRLHLP